MAVNMKEREKRRKGMSEGDYNMRYSLWKYFVMGKALNKYSIIGNVLFQFHKH